MDQKTVDAIVRLGRENSNWGYGRIANFVYWLDYKVSFMTIKRIINEQFTKNGVYYFLLFGTKLS